jgi:hypothetical protein
MRGRIGSLVGEPNLREVVDMLLEGSEPKLTCEVVRWQNVRMA